MRQFLVATIFTCFNLLNGGYVFAAPVLMLSSDPADRVGAGNSVEITIGVSGLDPDVDLGAYSFDFYFTNTANPFVTGSNFTFGGMLGDRPGINTLRGADLPPKLKGDGITYEIGFIYEVSLLDATALHNLQKDKNGTFDLVSIRLDTLYFNEPANRNLGIVASNFVLSDGQGDSIPSVYKIMPDGSLRLFDTNDVVLSKSITVVPEPTILSLIIFGLIGIRFNNWRSKQMK